jgi:hypothetical protein
LEALDAALKLRDLVSAKEAVTFLGGTDLLKQGTKLALGTASTISQAVYVVAKLTRNKAVIEQAETMLKAAAKGIGTVALLGDFFSALHGVAKLVDGDSAQEREEGLFEAASGAASGAGGVAKIAEMAAGDAASAAAWGARAAKATAWGIAIELEYQQLKAMAKLYGKTLLALTAPAVNAHYTRLRTDLTTLAEAAVDLQHWMDVHGAAILGGTPEDEIRLEQAVQEIRRRLPAVQRALRALDADTARMPTRMRDAFRKSEGLRSDWRLGTEDPSGDPVLIAGAALRAAEASFGIGDALVDDYEGVLRQAAAESADRFHGR